MRAVLVLNSYTRWGHDELINLEAETLMDWLEAVKNVYPKPRR